MKRALAILLAAAITALLCACGGENTTAQETTATAAPTTEATTVATTVETTEPEPEYTYVDITMDNWQEYFTLSEVTPQFSGNNFSSFIVELSLNEPYRDKVAHRWETDNMSLLDQEITMEVSYETIMYKLEVDAENQTVKKTRSSIQFVDRNEVDTIVLSDYKISFNGFSAVLIRKGNHVMASDSSGNEKEAGYTYPENVKITSISGVLPLLAE